MLLLLGLAIVTTTAAAAMPALPAEAVGSLWLLGAALTGGKLRWVRKNRHGEVIGTPSPAFSAVSADNVAPPRVVFNAPKMATDQDEKYSWLQPAAFSRGEYLAMQYFEATARTLTTANCKFNFSVYVKSVDHTGKVVERVEDRAHGDRMTKTGVNPDPRGLADNPVTIASEWSDIARFPPRSGSGEVPYGFHEVVVDGV